MERLQRFHTYCNLSCMGKAGVFLTKTLQRMVAPAYSKGANIMVPALCVLVILQMAGCGGAVVSGPSGGSGTNVPSTPSGLQATAGDAQITLTWTASSGSTGYKVLRSTTSGGPYTQIAAPSGSTYSDTGLTNGTTYYYVVVAVNAAGTSANSNQASATPIAAPSPATVTLAASPATIVSGGSSTLTWSSTNATTCAASAGWTGTKATSGTQSISPTATTSYTLTCTGTGGSANATATVTVNPSSSPVPSAPTNVKAFATTNGVYVLFTPPSNAQSSMLTQYTATTNTGYSNSVTPTRIQNEGNTLSYMQLNARIDINGVPAGTPVTVTVTAANAAGTSSASAPSNQVTPIAYAPLYVADGGSYTAESPSWGDYSYSGSPIYGVAPGTPSSHGTGNYPAPSNPISSANNVVEFDNPNSNGGFQPYFHHQDPNNNQNGRLNLAPYTDLVISVWPTADQGAFQQGLYVGVLKCLWVNGVITSSGSITLTDSIQNWPTNIFAGALVTDITNGNMVNVASNTSDTLTLNNSLAMNPGDFYEISVPDIGIGQEVIVGNGTATSYGPTNLVSGQWNTYTIPLTAFNGGSTSYPNVAGDQILKFNIVLSSNSIEVHYFSNIEFK